MFSRELSFEIDTEKDYKEFTRKLPNWYKEMDTQQPRPDSNRRFCLERAASQASGRRGQIKFAARGEGLEPSTMGPEPTVLPITPSPIKSNNTQQPRPDSNRRFWVENPASQASGRRGRISNKNIVIKLLFVTNLQYFQPILQLLSLYQEQILIRTMVDLFQFL